MNSARSVSPPTPGKPKLTIDAEFSTAAERDRLQGRIGAMAAARQGSERSKGKGRGDSGAHSAQSETVFSTGALRDLCKADVVAELQGADGLVRAHVHWHDCGEDEPEPVHLPYEHIDYQTWRATRNCRERNYGEVLIGG